MYHFTTRVYYEDTDAGGIVYHANYLKYMERCRCEWLDALGYSVVRLQDEYAVDFVVAQANIKFKAPAKLFDQINVSCEILQLGKVQLTLEQKIYNKNQEFCSGEIKLATLDRASYKLVTLPVALYDVMNNQTSVID